MKAKVLIMGTALVCGLAVQAHAQQKLADFRRVVVADNAIPVQKAAAQELCDYVGRIVGKPVEMVSLEKYDPAAAGLSFFVGDAAAKKLAGVDLAPWKDEEWLLRTIPQGLLVAGDDRAGDPWSVRTAAGSMLATYTLLDDHLGVHWFWPGPFGEHVPNNPDAVVPALDVRSAPRFMIRSVVNIGYGGYHTTAFNEGLKKWPRRSRMGWVRSAEFGHSWYDAFNLRNSDSFNAHPDWFALVNGKRQSGQVCTTNPEVIDHMVQYVLNSKLAITNISPSDGEGFCECPNCRALDVPSDNKTVSLSDRMFTYANEVARRVREKNPNKGVGMFAYVFYNSPPVKIKSLEPNLYLSFVFQCASFRNPQAYAGWKDTVAGWQKLDAKMVVREGYGNHYYLDLPFVHYNQIISSLAEASKLGFIAAYAGEGSKSFATMAPNYWAITHALWYPDRQTPGLMDEFWTSAYGPVAPQMKAFFETYNQALDRNWSKMRQIDPGAGIGYVNLINSWSFFLPREVVDEAEKHLVEAEKNVPAGEYADRVMFHRFGQEYTRTMLDLLDHYRQLCDLGLKLEFFVPAEGGPRTDPEAMQRLLKEAYDLGEKRELLLLAHRDWAGPDEGLYAYTNDSKIRQWHAEVKKALGIDKPTALTKALLAGH